MINSKKRSADTDCSADEPSKKRTLGFQKIADKEDSKKLKFSQPTKYGPFNKPDDGINKCNSKNIKKFDKKLGSKFEHRPGNKFAGEPKIFGKKLNRTVTLSKPDKTDWRKFKQDKKSLKLKRRQAKHSYEISIEAKQIYEKLKCHKTEKKADLVEELYNIFQAGDFIRKLVMAHDTARIIQCMHKFAAPALREQLSESLLPYTVEMSKSKYGQFCVLRMLKYGSPATKTKLVDSFIGNIVKLACHNISSKILDLAYLTVADSKQKAFMRQEFYGDLYKNSKDVNVKSLADCYRETSNMKTSILSAVKANLERIANKNLVDNSLVHAVMLDYVKEMEEDKVEESVTMFAPLVPLMLTTKDGCQAAIICFHKSTTKNRRAIIKNVKEHLVKICCHEHGHLFAIAVLNGLDDTKAIKKAIFDNIYPEWKTLMSNPWGRRVVEWLVSPGGTKCFHPKFIATVEEGLQYGKKDKNVRRKEIFEQIEEPIAKLIVENPEFWLSDKHIGLVTAEILKKLTSVHFANVAMALAKNVAKCDWKVHVESKDKKSKNTQDVEKIITEATKLKTKQRKQSQKITVNENVESERDEDSVTAEKEETSSESVLGIEEAGLHIVLKKFIKNDKERLSQDANCETFGKFLLLELNEDTVKLWLTINRACFILLNIAENNTNVIQEQIKELLKPHALLLKNQNFNGAKLLVEKLV